MTSNWFSVTKSIRGVSLGSTLVPAFMIRNKVEGWVEFSLIVQDFMDIYHGSNFQRFEH